MVLTRKKKLIDKTTVVIFILIIFFYIPSFVINCVSFKNFNFDSQSLLLWFYTAIKGYVPYKDLFYPYGLFSYYKQISPALNFFNLVLLSLLFTCYYKFFDLLFTKKYFALLSFAVFFLFINIYTSTDLFIRYGLLTGYSVLTALIVLADHKKNILLNVSLGLLAGLLFGLFPDQGIIAIAIYLIFLILRFIFINKSKKHDDFFQKTILTFLGFLSGIAATVGPFFLFLKLYGLFDSFLYSFVEYRNISIFAKIPFPPSLFTIDNVFSFTLLICATSYVSFKLFVMKVSFTRRDIIVAGLTVALLFLEVKNVMRSIDWQISFIGVILLFALIPPFIYEVLSIRKGFLYILTIGSFLIIAFGFNHQSIYKNPLMFFGNKISGGPNACFQDIIRKLPESANQRYVHDEIIKKNYGTNVFSYPQDPIFYILFNQKPPYYPTIYESSFEEGQRRTIDYLIKNRIDIVIINNAINSVQDNVPDFVRSKNLLKYITNNYGYLATIKNFTLLKRGYGKNIFETGRPQEITKVKNLLNVNLGSISYIEARDKTKYLGRPLSSFSSADALNSYFSINQFGTENRLMLFKAVNANDISLTLISKTGLKTRVTLSNCKYYCLLDFDSIPLFYKNREIAKITSDQVLEDIKIFEKKNSIFW